MKSQYNDNNTHIPELKSRFLRIVLIMSGFISLALGVIGIILPILPTTPFIILSAACFARSSKHFYDWLYGNRLFGKILRDYRDRKGLELKYKIYILTMLWLTIGTTALFIVDIPLISILLFAVAMGVTIHIWRFKTIK